MSTRLLSLSLAVLAAFTSAACFPKSGPIPGPASPEEVKAAAVKWPGVTETQLAEGRQLFTDRCNKCHGYPDVNAKEEGEWPSIMERMAEKAKLDVAQKQNVLHFVLASRNQP